MCFFVCAEGHITSQFERKNLYTGSTELFNPVQVFTSPSIKYCACVKPVAGACCSSIYRDRTRVCWLGSSRGMIFIISTTTRLIAGTCYGNSTFVFLRPVLPCAGGAKYTVAPKRSTGVCFAWHSRCGLWGRHTRGTRFPSVFATKRQLSSGRAAVSRCTALQCQAGFAVGRSLPPAAGRGRHATYTSHRAAGSAAAGHV